MKAYHGDDVEYNSAIATNALYYINPIETDTMAFEGGQLKRPFLQELRDLWFPPSLQCVQILAKRDTVKFSQDQSSLPL